MNQKYTYEMIKINTTHVILWEGHNVTYIVCWLGMYNLNLIIRNIRQIQNEEYSILKIMKPQEMTLWIMGEHCILPHFSPWGCTKFYFH